MGKQHSAPSPSVRVEVTSLDGKGKKTCKCLVISLTHNIFSSHSRVLPSLDTVDASARLSTILWLLAAEPGADREKILKAVHFKLGSGVLGFEDTVPKDGSGVLTLVMCASFSLLLTCSILTFASPTPA